MRRDETAAVNHDVPTHPLQPLDCRVNLDAHSGWVCRMEYWMKVVDAQGIVARPMRTRRG